MARVAVSSNRPPSRPRIGSFVPFLVFIAVIGGLLFGYDSGIVSSALLYLPSSSAMHGMNSVWQEIVVSATPGMAAIGSLLSSPLSDRWGRKRSIVSASCLFIFGAVICSTAWNLYSLLFGRIVLGLAIGMSSMSVPVYVGETSPAHIRGSLVTTFQLMITLGFVLANLIAASLSYIQIGGGPSNIGWRLMLGLAAVPALIQFLGFFWLPESPRWLVEKDREIEAKQVLARIYSGQTDWIQYEMEEIINSKRGEKAVTEHDSFILFRILKTSHVCKALLIGCALQAFQQLSGVNTIMYYTGTIVKSAGVTNNHTAIWISSALSTVNFLATLIPLSLVERVGRRLMLLLSVLGVFISLLLIAAAFLLINRTSRQIFPDQATNGFNMTAFNSSAQLQLDFHKCSDISNCDSCVTREKCGYCTPKYGINGSAAYRWAQCLAVEHEDSYYSQLGYCSRDQQQTQSNYTFSKDFCHTQYTFLPILLMVVYLVCFASGFAPLPWVLNAELYPLWARSTCVSIATFTNWTFNLIISLTFLSLSQTVTKYGAFLIYASFTLLALVIFYITVPETKGMAIEEVQLLFMPKDERRCVDSISRPIDDPKRRNNDQQ